MAGARLSALSVLQSMRKEEGLPPAPKKEPALVITAEIKEAAMRYAIKSKVPNYNDPNFIASPDILKTLNAVANQAIKDLKNKKLSLSDIGLEEQVAQPVKAARKPRSVSEEKPATSRGRKPKNA